MDGITTAANGYHRPTHWPNRDWEALPHSHRVHVVCSRAVPIGVPRHPDRAVHARMEAGRWLAECAGCPSAQFVSPADPWFCCVEITCGWARSWCSVVWPDEHERLAVELAAAQLPVDDRNWVHRDDRTDTADGHRRLSRLIPSPVGAS